MGGDLLPGYGGKWGFVEVTVDFIPDLTGEVKKGEWCSSSYHFGER
jgi:hypothetical protein